MKGKLADMMSKETMERFWIYTEKTPTCWNWKGYKLRGYSQFRVNGRNLQAHRFAYEVFKGKIPESLTIDHLCRNRMCVNPDHLEAVTVKVNELRGETIAAKNVKKTHCPKGHPYSGTNSRGNRVCRICHNEAEQKWWNKTNG